MTDKEKARRYDEAIGKAKELKNNPFAGYDGTDLLSALFPELKESEDEDKRMIRIIEDAICTNEAQQLVKINYGLELTDLADWLEKQGEHANFRNKIQVGDEVTRNEDGVLVNLSQLNRVAKPADAVESEKQGEQKTIDANEEDNDFTIYHPIKNERSNKYECFPYSFYGSIEAFHNNEELLCFLRNCFYKKEDCEKWCREQNEQKPVEEANGEDIPKGGIVLEDFNGGDGFYKVNLAYLKKSQVEDIESLVDFWHRGNDDKIRACIQMILTDASNNRFDNYHTNLLECSDWVKFKALHPQPKQEWSEEDERMFKYIIDLCDEKMKSTLYQNVIDYAINVKNWFLSLKDRVQPQPQQEWSEEDKSRMDNLCHFLEEYGNHYYGCLTLQCTISWLKSLRPQNRWKPSDEQIRCLEYAIKLYDSYEAKHHVLKSLYKDITNIINN